MDPPTWLPEKDICATECENIADFKKSAKTPEHVLKKVYKEYEEFVQNQEKPPVKPVQPHEVVRPETDFQHELKEIENSLTPDKDGEIDWSSLSKMSGIRPPVHKYSGYRYSINEWTKHNKDMLNSSTIHKSNIVEYNGRTCIQQAIGNVDNTQHQNNNKLKLRAKDLYRWKVEVEVACKAITKEVELLERERHRTKRALRALVSPECISKECLELRSNLFETCLVADQAHTELITEKKLVNEVKEIFHKTLNDVEEQMKINKAAKHRVEYDWCDKMTAYETEAKNLSLTTKSNTIMLQQGSVKFSPYTGTVEYWEYFCKETVENCEAARQTSMDLRSDVIAILVNYGRKLRTQADKVDMALAESVAITSALCTKLEETLRDTLQKIADLESLIKDLTASILKMDAAMKLAQTRLENRNNCRPHGENIRDAVHLGLIEEVKKIHETVTSLRSQINNSEGMRKELMAKRAELEKEIAAKRHLLAIDRQRCVMVRSHYPSSQELSGQ